MINNVNRTFTTTPLLGYFWTVIEYLCVGWYSGGGRGIQTPEDLAALTDFKSQRLE